MEPWAKLLLGLFFSIFLVITSVIITLSLEVCNRPSWSACSVTCGEGISTKDDRWYCSGEKTRTCWLQNCTVEVEDFCKENPCHTNATCTNNEDSFTCTCKSTLIGDGITNCAEEITCSENSCSANALCSVSDNAINCACLAGFSGDPFVNCAAITESLLIGAFNIQIFGVSKMSKPEVVTVLVDIVQRYDIIMIQEIRDASQNSFPQLVAEVNANSTYEYHSEISERTGRSSSKEQYGYIWRSDKVRQISTYQYPDDGDIFEREPYSVQFERVNSGSPQRFSYISIHAKPDDAVAEINHLDNVYEIVASAYGDDALIGGDYNADCSYVCSSCWDDIDMWDNPIYTWLIASDADTTLSNTDCAYDRLVVAGSDMISNSSPGAVFRFDLEYNLAEEEAKDVSDHYPVEFTLG